MAVFNNDGKDFVEGILNDWDHAERIDVDESQRIVRLSTTHIPLRL